MSSTTGAVLLLVAGLGSMGIVTYRALTNNNQPAQEVRELLKQDRELVHIRFVTHKSNSDLRVALNKLKVPYRQGAPATKVALSETSCEVHVVITPTQSKPTDEFVAKQVEECRKMSSEFKGKAVSY